MILTSHQPNFLPYMGVIYKAYKSDAIVLSDDVCYSKKGMHNWNVIRAKNGSQKITVPVNAHHDTKLCDVMISEPRKTLPKIVRTLEETYAKTKHFEEGQEILDIIRDMAVDGTGLTELNIVIIKHILDHMSGVKDVIDTTCNMLSAVTNIPQTILFGRSPAGMNATGDSDLENYYNMVENIQKQNMKANARTVIDLILKQGLIEGKIPEIPKYKMKFAALWSLSDTEQADIAQKKAATEQTKAQTAQVYIDSGVLDPSEVRSSLATEGEFDIEEVITEDDLNLPEDTFSPTEMSGTLMGLMNPN